jgi:hypothetical protein
MYFVLLMRPLSVEITPEEAEIQEARWMKVLL